MRQEKLQKLADPIKYIIIDTLKIGTFFNKSRNPSNCYIDVRPSSLFCQAVCAQVRRVAPL